MRRAVSRFIPNKTRVLNNAVIKNLKLDLNSIEDLYITLDEPHRTWLPGEEISGQIVLILKKNLLNISVSLSLGGYVKIKSSPTTNIRHKKFHLFNHTIKIYGSLDLPDEENGLSKGEHRFPFIVKLPTKNIYTSVDFGRGSITYLVKASINLLSDTFANDSEEETKMRDPFYSCEKLINLISPINVSKLPPPKPKTLLIKSPKKLSKTVSSTSTLNSFNTVSSLNSDPNSISNGNSSNLSIGDQQSLLSKIRLSMEISHRGFLRGELIPIKISLQHIKKLQDLGGIIITLVRICRVDNGPDLMVESFRKDLVQTVVPLYVDPVTFKTELNTSIRIPADAFPTISGCPLVSFQYFIEALVNFSGKSFESTNTNKEFNKSASAVGLNREITNTDKLKRLKNVLQLTMEVVVGTERNESSPISYNNGSKASLTESRKNSLSNNNSPLGIENAIDENGEPNDESPQTSNVSSGPSSTSISFQIPDHPNRIRSQLHPAITPSAPPIPNYVDSQMTYRHHTSSSSPLHNFRHLPSPTNDRFNIPILPEVSEKELLRIREESLLPSEPRLTPVYSESTLEMNTELPGPSAPPASEDFRTSSFHQSDMLNSESSNTSNEEDQDKLEKERNRLLSLQSGPPIPSFNRTVSFENGENITNTVSNTTSNEQPQFDDDYSDIDYVPMYDKVSDDELLDNNALSSPTYADNGICNNELHRIATAGT